MEKTYFLILSFLIIFVKFGVIILIYEFSARSLWICLDISKNKRI